MFAVIITIIFAIGVAFFATQNTVPVALNFFHYNMSVSLYLVVLTSILLGFIFAWLLHLMNAFTSLYALHGKDNEIKKEKKVNTELTNKVRNLEVERSKLEKEKTSATNR